MGPIVAVDGAAVVILVLKFLAGRSDILAVGYTNITTGTAVELVADDAIVGYAGREGAITHTYACTCRCLVCTKLQSNLDYPNFVFPNTSTNRTSFPGTMHKFIHS